MYLSIHPFRKEYICEFVRVLSASAKHGMSEDDHLNEAMNMDSEGIDKESGLLVTFPPGFAFVGRTRRRPF